MGSDLRTSCFRKGIGVVHALQPVCDDPLRTIIPLDRDRWAFRLLIHVPMATSLVDPSLDLCRVAAHVAIYFDRFHLLWCLDCVATRYMVTRSCIVVLSLLA